MTLIAVAACSINQCFIKGSSGTRKIPHGCCLICTVWAHALHLTPQLITFSSSMHELLLVLPQYAQHGNVQYCVNYARFLLRTSAGSSALTSCSPLCASSFPSHCSRESFWHTYRPAAFQAGGWNGVCSSLSESCSVRFRGSTSPSELSPSVPCLYGTHRTPRQIELTTLLEQYHTKQVLARTLLILNSMSCTVHHMCPAKMQVCW